MPSRSVFRAGSGGRCCYFKRFHKGGNKPGEPGDLLKVVQLQGCLGGIPAQVCLPQTPRFHGHTAAVQECPEAPGLMLWARIGGCIGAGVNWGGKGLGERELWRNLSPWGQGGGSEKGGDGDGPRVRAPEGGLGLSFLCRNGLLEELPRALPPPAPTLCTALRGSVTSSSLSPAPPPPTPLPALILSQAPTNSPGQILPNPSFRILKGRA